MIELNHEQAQTAGAELEERSTALVQRLGTRLIIRDAAGLEAAVLDRRTIADQIAAAGRLLDEPIAAAHRTHKILCDRKRAIVGPLEQFDQRLKLAISDFKTAADREREALERELSEQQRQDDHARAAAEAAALERQGQPDAAAAVLEEAIAAPAPLVVVPDLTKVSGLKFRRYHRWKYAGGPTDLERTPGVLIARCLEIIPREFLMVDEKKLTKYAAAMKEGAQVRGIHFYFVDEPIR